MDDFKVLIEAVLDKAKLGKEFKNAQKIADARNLKLKVNLDQTILQRDIVKISGSLAKIFNKKYKLNIDSREAVDAIKSFYKEQEKLNKHSIAQSLVSQISYYEQIQENLKNIYTLSMKLPSASKAEIIELQKQLVLLEKLSQYKNKLNIKRSKDDTLNWEINNLNDIIKKRLKLNSIKKSFKMPSAENGTDKIFSQDLEKNIDRIFNKIILNWRYITSKIKIGEVLDENSFQKLQNSLTKIEKSSHGVGSELEYIKSNINNVDDSTALLKDLADAFNALPRNAEEMANPLSWMGAVITTISFIVKTMEKMKKETLEGTEAAKLLIQNYNTSLEKANNNADVVEELIPKYTQLANGVDNLGRNISLTAEEYKEYNKLTNQIADMFPNLVSGYTNEGTAILNLKGNVEKLRDSYKEVQHEASKILTLPSESLEDALQHYQNKTQGKKYFLQPLTDYSGMAGSEIIIEIMDALSNTSNIEDFHSTYESLIKKYRKIINTSDLKKAFENAGLNSPEFNRNLPVDEIYTTRSFGSDPIDYTNFTWDDFNMVKKNARLVADTYRAETQTNLSIIKDSINEFIYQNADYQSLDEETQNIFSILLNSLDTNLTKDFKTPQDIGNYVNKTIDSLISNNEARNALAQLLTIDTSDMTVSEIKTTVDNYLKTISSVLENESPITLKARLGFEYVDDLATAYDDAIANFINKIENSVPHLPDEMNSMIKNAGGTVDISNQPSISPMRLKDAGWDFQVGSVSNSTLYPKHYSNKDGTTTVVVTPILPDGSVLSPEELKTYAENILAGETIDANILLGKYDGDDSIQKAKQYSQYLDQYFEDLWGSNQNAAKKLQKFFDSSNINTKEKIDLWNQVTKDIYSINRAKETYIQADLSNDINARTMSYEDAYSTYSQGIQNAKDKIIKLQAASDLLTSNSLNIPDIDVLIQDFPELNNYIDITDEKFGNLQYGLEELSKKAPKEVLDSLKSIIPISEEDKKKIETIIESLEIMSGIKPDNSMRASLDLYDELSAKLTSLSDLQTDLGNHFSLTSQQARKYAEIFPEILSLGTVNSEGLIELNEEVANSFIEAKEKEVEADREAKIIELENQKIAIEGEIEEAQARLQLLEDASNGEIDAKNQLMAALAEDDDNYAQHQSDINTALTNDDANAKEIMAGNLQEYNNVAAGVSTDIYTNLSNSINKAAKNIHIKSGGIIDSLFKIGAQAIASAYAILNIGSGKEPIEVKKEVVIDENDVIEDFVVTQIDTPFNRKDKDKLDFDKFVETEKKVELKNIQELSEKEDSIISKINLLKSQNYTQTFEEIKDQRDYTNNNNSAPTYTKIDWIKQVIDLLDKKRAELTEKANSTSLSILGLSEDEISRAKELAEKGMPESAELNEFINLAQKAGISYNELYEKIQNGDDLNSRQTFLEMRAENDKVALGEYEKIVDAYRSYYEDLASDIPAEYRDLIENGNFYIEMVPSDEADKLKEVMSAYSEYMNQYSEQNKRIEQYKQGIIDIHENRIKQLDYEGDLIENNNKLINSQIEYLKTSGQIVSVSFYDNLIANSDRLVKIIEDKILEKKKELEDLLNDESIDVDQKSEDSYKLQKEIDDLEASKVNETVSKAKLIFDRLKMPIDNMDIVIGMYNDISTALQNWGSVYEASGKKLDSSYYQTLITNGATIIDHHKKQADAVQNLMGRYKEGSETWNDLYSKLQSINSEMSSMVQNLHQWNEALLQMPLDSIKEYSSTLQQALDGMTDLQSDYDAVLSAVTGAIQEQIDALQEENELTNDTYQNQIDALQEQLDLLDKANEARQYQLSVEQALYELEKARNQKTTRVIRDGQTTYESDSEAVRNAENSLADAQYELEKYNLQTKMDGLQEELDGINEAYDGQVEKLEKISEKWSEIKDNIETAKNEALAADYLGSGWKNTILNGDDTELYNLFKGLNESLSQQMTNYEEQINTTENISSLLENYITSYKEGTLSYDQAVAGIKDLLSQINEKMSAEDNLQNIYDYLGAVGGTSADAESILAAVQQSLTQTADELLKSMAQYNENSGMISEYTSSWQQLTDNVANMKDILEDVRDNLADALEGRDNDDDDDNGRKIAGHGPRYDNESVNPGPGAYLAEGIKHGLVGSNSITNRETVLKLLGLKKLNNDEVRAILHKGEAVYNPLQQRMLLDNFAFAYNCIPDLDIPSLDYSSLTTIKKDQPTQQFNFGDIQIQKCDNPDGFAKALGSELRSSLRIDLGRR